jgi:hypothetical protein
METQTMTYNEKQTNPDPKKQQPGDFNKKNAGGNVGEKPESKNAGSSSNVNQQRPDQNRSDIKNGSQGTTSKGNM